MPHRHATAPSPSSERAIGFRRARMLAAASLAVVGVLAVAPTAKADPPQASTEPATNQAAPPAPASTAPAPAEPASIEPAPTAPAPTGVSVPAPPAADSGTALAPEQPTPPPEAREMNAFARGLVWGGTVAGVSLLSSMVLEVGVLPPVEDNGPRILLLAGASMVLGAGVGWLAAELGWPEQGALALIGATWGAFALAPFGMLIDGGRSMTTDGLDVGPFTAASALLGAAAFGVLSPLLLDVHETPETGALYVAPGLGAFAGTIVWLALWLFGVVPDDPSTSSRALMAAAGIGGTLGLALPFAIRGFRATSD